MPPDRSFDRFQPGVKRDESIAKALKREVHESTGLRVENGALLGYRRDKDSITLLFAAFPDKVKTIEIFDPLEPASRPISTS